MKRTKEELLLAKSDYEVIMMSLKGNHGNTTYDRRDAAELEAELKKAVIVSAEDLPADVVRLNSHVTIEDEKAKKVMELIVVTPERADIRQGKISIMSPIGTALIGYKKGKKVSWQVPSGKKTFTILDVRL